MKKDASEEVFAMGIERLEALAAAAGACEVTPSLEMTRERVMQRIDEGFGILIGCALHFPALAAQGLTEAETRRFRSLLLGLKSAQALFEGVPTERARSVRARLYDAVGDAAGRLRARAAFTFRFDADGARLRAFTSPREPRRVDGALGRRALRCAIEWKPQ